MAYSEGSVGWVIRPAQIEPLMVMVWDEDGSVMYYGPKAEINLTSLQLLSQKVRIDEQGCEHYQLKGGEESAGDERPGDG